jgi:hypothetical protein
MLSAAKHPLLPCQSTAPRPKMDTLWVHLGMTGRDQFV